MKFLKLIAAVVLSISLCGEQSSARFPHGSALVVSGGGGGTLLNIASPSYFGGYSPWLNWWKNGSIMNLTSGTNGALTGQQIWDNGTYFNSNGELNNPLPADVQSISRGFFTPVIQAQYQYQGTAFGQFAGQVWDVSWTGCTTSAMTVTTTGTLGTGGSPGSSFSGNSGTITLGNSGFSNVGIQFALTASGACYTNPPRNITVSQHQYATNVANGELTNPDWRAAVRPFKFLRLMDLMSTNGSSISASTQLAGLSYTSYGAYFNMAWSDRTGSISGSVLTSSGHAGANWRVGQSIFCIGCTAGTTITSFGTGTGGDGTYNLNQSMTISNTQIVGIEPAGVNQAYGPRAGIAPDVACKIANEVGTGIEYPIPIAATNQFATDIATSFQACTTQTVKFSFGNEDWNPAFLQYYYGFALAASVSQPSGYAWAGYRAAQLFSIIRGIYGTNSSETGRWVGALGSQTANTAVTTDVLSGAQAAVTAGSLAPLPQLASSVDIAPYLGDFTPVINISNITASATPTVTASNDDGSGSPFFKNGDIVKIFTTGGTMAAALNNQYVTVSSATTTSFQINTSTSGLTYGNSCATSCTDFAMPGTLFKMADQSLSLNGSAPATYPTKYSFFAQQMSKAILNGSATDASYGTLAWNAYGNLSGSAGSIQSLFSQHALKANAVGLTVRQYEGGNGVSLAGRATNTPPAQMLDYLANWQFDNGVTGDSTNTIGNLYAVQRAAFCSLQGGYSSYPAQFTDASPQSQFGPWGALRFFPGDTGNPKWTAVAAWNTAGPCVDPTPTATGSYSVLNAGAPFETNSSTSAQTVSGVAYGTGASYAIVVTYSQNTPTITNVTIDGTALSLDVAHSTSTTAIYSGPIPSGAATRTVVVNWVSAGFQQRGFYAFKATGLLNNAPASISATNLGSGGTISELKGALVICAGNLSTGSPTYSTSTVAPSGFNNASGGQGTAAWWLGNITFSSSIFQCTWGGGAGGGALLATYR